MSTGKGSLVATAMTSLADGLYEFNDLDEGAPMLIDRDEHR